MGKGTVVNITSLKLTGEEMENEYYIVSVKHMGHSDNTFQLWGENGSGYYRSIEDSGLYELPKDFKELELKWEKIYVHKDKLKPLFETVRLPIYGGYKETYAGRNEFTVLPNTGQVRKALGITTHDIRIEGNRDSFDAYFVDTVREKFKNEYSKTHFNVRLKQLAGVEWWHYQDYQTEAKTRNEAILKAKKDWWFDESYIEFKSMVTCSRSEIKVLDKWIAA